VKCPHCGAWSEVLSTREAQEWATRRRRECGNGHKFSTYEVLQTVWAHGRHRHAGAVETVRRRVALWRRNRAILAALAAGRQGKEIAAELGVSTSTVSLVKRQAEKISPGTTPDPRPSD
jgi:DNA-binding NarL/FixJ family response regulator